ncbi:hypothetical protein F0562_030610 [Nyssa sinensis]|uniref:Uncharacterized protein n=1 Tax=Nyssa sinensis TaxID=561372 RepID=A0A5J5B1D9_9ASTE|nr:hypothetical protein F0562_030610 [Nyssa sinensis]
MAQSPRHVGPVDVDATKDMEADVAKVGGAVLDDDYLVNQTPPQYRRDPTPPRPFYSDPGASSSSAPSSVIHERQDQFAVSLYMIATDLHSLIPNDDDDDDDDDGDDGDGDFPPDSSTA